MDDPDNILKPVAWLIDDDTEHARVILGSDWQASKMGEYNRLLVTLLDAQEAIFRAVKAERERCAKACDDARPAGGRAWSAEQAACYECLTRVSAYILNTL